MPDVCAASPWANTALCVRQVCLILSNAQRLCAKRGRIMDEAFPEGTGGMLSVIGLTAHQMSKTIESCHDVYLANHLSDLQTVIAGRAERP